MMKEHEQYFAMTLQQKLKKQVIGRVFVKITYNDEILVVIRYSDEEEFKMFIPNFTEQLINGLSTDYVAYNVIREYRTCLIRRLDERYFYQD